MSDRSIDTDLVHAGEPSPRIAGAVAMPVFQSSTFEMAAEALYHDLRYMRLNNTPNHLALHAKLAAIEGGDAGLVTSSGMAAISTTLLTLLGPGDHLLAQKCLYGGTHDLITQDLTRLRIEHTFFDAGDPSQLSELVRAETKAIYCETITNPLVEVGDLPGVAAFARARGLVSIIDNTFATPVNFRPIAHGFDLVLHSATKYLNGHSDIVAGAVIGRRELVDRVRHKLAHLGGCLDAHACHLLHRGLKTLAVRVRHQNASALRVAEFLAAHQAIERVHYPGLPGHPDHARAKELLAGFGGMLSFEPRGGAAASARLIDRLRLCTHAPSLGGPETLVTRPATTSHVGTDPAARAAVGITDALVRVSVGLEDPADLFQDFAQALA
jgi:cystathionine beta-lyase/cystathionine gamma-synthase